MLANRYNDAKETLKEYFQNQINMLDQEEAGISTADVASYIKEEESTAMLEEASMTENEETKINVKLKEIMETNKMK